MDEWMSGADERLLSVSWPPWRWHIGDVRYGCALARLFAALANIARRGTPSSPTYVEYLPLHLD